MSSSVFTFFFGLLVVTGSLSLMFIRRSVIAQSTAWSLAAIGCVGLFAAAAAPVVAALLLLSVLPMCGGALLLVDSESRFAQAGSARPSTSRLIIRFFSVVAVWVGVVLWVQDRIRVVSWVETARPFSTYPAELIRGEALAGWFLGSAPSTVLACGLLGLVALLAPLVFSSKEEVK